MRGADGHWTALEQPVTAADGFIAVLLKSVEVDGTVHEVQPQEDGTIRFEVELSTSETGHPRWCEVAFLTTSPNFSAFALARIAEGEDHHMYSSSVPLGTDSAITVRAFYGNVGSRVQNNVVAVASLPKSVELVPSTTSITNSNQPHGLAASDNLTSRGINFGNY